MDIKVNNLKKAYEALKEACSNCSLDYIEIYKRGCKLLPKNKKEIINIRNDFAHAKLEEEKDSNGSIVRKYFKKCDITFGQEYCKTIRKNIVKHKKNLEMLKNKIDE